VITWQDKRQVRGSESSEIQISTITKRRCHT